MNDYELFNSVNNLVSMAKEKKRQASIRGENYNVFDILGMTTSEVKLHSSFIADLLNPHGLHGLGSKPLKCFLDIIKLQFAEDDLLKADVVTEYHIGNISEDYSWGGNIDILIRIKDHYIAIENKINAGDQPKQLVRYKNFIKRHPHKLIYLTIDGHEPSEDSSEGLENNIDYWCISYGVEMFKWLQEILMMSVSRPLIRETTQQYIKVIKELTNQEMEETDKTELFKVMDKNPAVVKELVNSQWYYRQHIVKTYILEPLKKYFTDKGFEWYEDDNFKDQSKESGFGIYLPTWEKMISIEFEKYDYNSGFYGVWDPKHRGSERSPLVGNKNTLAWPYGWENLKYNSWNINSVEEIVSGEVFEDIVRIFEELYQKLIENPFDYPMD